MPDNKAPPSTKDGLNISASGEIMVPTDPKVAKLRLAELEADPDYITTIMDRQHPLHEARNIERRALMFYASQSAT